jgi:hypothetical protein
LAPCGRRPHTPSHPGAGPEPSGRRVRLVAGRDWLSTAFLQRLSLLHLLLLGLAFLSLPLLTLALGYGLRSWFCHRIGLRPVRSTNLAEIEARRTMPGLAQSTLCTRSSWFEGTVRIESRDLLDVSPWPTMAYPMPCGRPWRRGSRRPTHNNYLQGFGTAELFLEDLARNWCPQGDSPLGVWVGVDGDQREPTRVASSEKSDPFNAKLRTRRFESSRAHHCFPLEIDSQQDIFVTFAGWLQGSAVSLQSKSCEVEGV